MVRQLKVKNKLSVISTYTLVNIQASIKSTTEITQCKIFAKNTIDQNKILPVIHKASSADEVASQHAAILCAM